MSTVPATNVRALAAAVCDGELTPEQRECLVDLLHTLNAASTLAQRDHYLDNDTAALGYLISTWEPVKRAYAELAATARLSGEANAA